MPPSHDNAHLTNMMKEIRPRSNIVSLFQKILVVAIATIAFGQILLHHSIVYSPTQSTHHVIPYLRAFSTSNRENSNHSGISIRLPPTIDGSERFLLLNAMKARPVWDDVTDDEIEAERCRRYYTYTNNTRLFTDYKARKRRRVFLGSLIADDSWHALGALAMETYGIYTAVVFVESNRTQTGTPRQLRFMDGTVEHNILTNSNLFGPNTPVLIDHFSYEGEIDGGGLIREHMQRNLILEMWKRAGMTPDDIGVLTDADETPTRDFLRAVQMCDMPQFDPKEQNCHTAKVIVSSLVFEGSPECMTTTRKWMHPDIILGKCIEGIGDDEFKLNSRQRQRKFAWRKNQYTLKLGNYSGWPKEKKTFPLWNAADFRRDQGGFDIFFEYVQYLPLGMGHTGYHFHNYFDTTNQLRNKYMTYGHPIPDVDQMSVSEIHPDLDLMVDCVLQRSTTNNKHNTLSTELKKFEGRIPIAYELDGYTVARHRELKMILTVDAKGHNLTWHDTLKSKDWYEKIPL